MGEAPSLAACLQRLAAPNSVLIAESTRRLVGELFEYQTVEANGVGDPVPAWQVLRRAPFRAGSRRCADWR